jgi:prepilin-type N-terminal cleavage/methylation domain-containing protein
MTRISKTRDNLRGFTLVELLVVIAIISILATLLLLQLGVARAKARDAKRIADVNQVRSALEMYYDDNASYLATNVMTGLSPTYLVNVPNDPLAVCTAGTYNGVVSGAVNCYGYGYNTAASPTKFQIWAELEQKNTNALNSDTDFTAAQIAGWQGSPRAGNGPVGSNNEVCVGTTAGDCIYDSGQP